MATDLLVSTPLTFSIDVAPLQTVSIAAAPGQTVILVPVPGVPGQRGQTGPAGNGTQAIGEIPGGMCNGTNTVFTLANPYQANSTAVYRNGLRQQLNSGYTETTDTEITFTDAPSAGTELVVDYLIQ